MKKNCPLLANVMLVLGLQLSVVSFAAEESVTLVIGANVPTQITLSVEGHPDRLVVGSEAIAKQQLDYDAVLTVQSNNPNGFSLSIASTAKPYYRWVELNIDTQHYLLLPGGQVHIPVAYLESETWVHRLRYRFALATGVSKGQHSWPLEVSVAPL